MPLKAPLPNLPPDRLARLRGFSRIAGVDEAGRGPWAGPVVAAAVVLSATPLRVRVGDSKRLTGLQRERAFEAIMASADVGIGIVPAPVIDRDNILQAALAAMRRAVADLRVAPDLVMVDGPLAPPVTMPCWPVVRGDQLSRAIGCASIVAKVLRDALMTFYDELYPAYGFHQHKGYGTSLHAKRLALHGPSPLHRRSFQPVRNITEAQR